MLEALEAVPSRVANRSLVSLFNPTFIPQVLGFKFQYYAGPSAGATPESLYHMCGLLLQEGAVTLAQVKMHAYSV